MKPVVYRSRVDNWLVIVFALSSIAAVAACIPLMRHGSHSNWVVAAATLLAGIGLPWWILSTTTYTITDDALLIHSGPFHWRIALRDITAIAATRNPLSSPALSLDRLRIEYRGGPWIMISPADRRGFLADLEARGVEAAGNSRGKNGNGV
jgi:hypothetical protein